MRLLLDEHYSHQIAQQLRSRGHDVIAVSERDDLSGLSDLELLWRMVKEQRAIVTNDVKDFVPHTNRMVLEGDSHFGVLLTSDRSMPRHGNGVGHIIRALDTFLKAHPAEDGFRDQVQWLSGSG